MADDIGLGLSSMAVCFDFCSTNVVQLSKLNTNFYRFHWHHPLITQLTKTHVLVVHYFQEAAALLDKGQSPPINSNTPN